VEADGSAAAAEDMLSTRLQQNKALELGTLDNGLRYVLLPNRTPPARFEAHLEIHAGSGAPPCIRG
jgi:predicted Zn-dependent peptidase